MFKYTYVLILLNFVLISWVQGYTLDEVLVKELKKNINISDKLKVFKELELEYSQDANKSSSFNTGLKDDYKAVIKVTQNIFDELDMRGETSLKEARLLASAKNYLESVNTLVYKVTKLYIEVVHSVERVAIAQEIFETYQKTYSEINVSYKLDLITKHEKTKFKSFVTLSRAELEKEKIKEKQSKKNLGYFLNVPKEYRFDFDKKVPLAKEKIIFYVLEYNPSLFEYRYNINNLEGIANEFSKGEGSFTQRITFGDTQEFEKQVVSEIEFIWNKNKRLEEKLINLVWYSHYYAASLALLKAEYALGKILFIDVLLAKNDTLKSAKDIIETRYNLLFTQLHLLDTMGSLVPKISTSIGIKKVQESIKKKVTLYINFKYSSSSLPKSVEEELTKISLYLLNNPSFKLRITGHTSKTKHSKEKSNIALSYKRANKVKDELINVYGISKTRVFIYGKGHNEPIADNAMSEGRIKNRRIEIELFE